MSVAYGWFLSTEYPKDAVLEFVRIMPNDGLTERIDDQWVDVFKNERGDVMVERADVDAIADELGRDHSGSIDNALASVLELAQCICLEMPDGPRTGGRSFRFRGRRCVDLATTLSRVEGLIGDKFDDGSGGRRLEALRQSLARALDLHIAVMFGEG